MDAAEAFLTEKRAAVAELERTLDLARAELRGMEAFAKAVDDAAQQRTQTALMVRSAPARAGAAAADAASKGRQLGSISMRWRAVLWHLDALGGNFTPHDIVGAVRDLEAREMRPADAKRQMDAYAVLGFVNDDDGVFNVTDQFKSKFAESATAHNENAPPSELDGADEALTAH